MMTERMRAYRKRMEEKGLVQVRVWVEKQDEEFMKFIAEFCREEKDDGKRTPKKRFGHRASDRQIEIAKEIALANSVPEPEHLYDHHISLGAWIWGQGGRRNKSKEKVTRS